MVYRSALVGIEDSKIYFNTYVIFRCKAATD